MSAKIAVLATVIDIEAKIMVAWSQYASVVVMPPVISASL